MRNPSFIEGSIALVATILLRVEWLKVTGCHMRMSTHRCRNHSSSCGVVESRFRDSIEDITNRRNHSSSCGVVESSRRISIVLFDNSTSKPFFFVWSG